MGISLLQLKAVLISAKYKARKLKKERRTQTNGRYFNYKRKELYNLMHMLLP